MTAIVIADRVRETTATSGTGPVALAGAVTDFQSFNSAFSSGQTVCYCIDDGAGNWEVGYGVFTAPSTLARGTVLASSNGNALVNFGVNSKQVFCTAAAALLPLLDSNGDLVGTIIPRTGTLASLLALAGNAGEIGAATDQAALVEFTGTAAAAAAFFPSGVEHATIGGNTGLFAIGGTANAPAKPAAIGAHSLTLLGDPTVSGSSYAAGGLGTDDIVIGTQTNTTLLGGNTNILLGGNIVLGAAPNGTTSVGNTLVAGNASDGYCANNLAIGAAGSAALVARTTYSFALGPGCTVSVGSTALAGGTNAGNFNVAIGYNCSVTPSAGSALALSANYLTVVGSLQALTGGAQLCAMFGLNNNLNPTVSNVSDDAGLFGMGLQDGAMAGVARFGTSQIAGGGNAPEALIDCIPDGSGSNNVNNSLILIGSAKQYGDNPLVGAASSRGTLTGGRGANAAYQFALADQGYVAIAPTTGTTVTIPNGCSTYVINPSGALAALTVKMPANPIDGQFVTLTATQTVTTLTLQANASQSLDGAIATIGVGTPATYMFCASGATANAPANTWVRVR